MIPSGLDWRDPYYVQELNDVLFQFDKSPEKNSLVNALFGEENLLDGKSSLNEQQQYDSPVSMNSGQSASSTATFFGSPESCGGSSNATLTPTSTSSSSPVEISSPTSNNTMCCYICNTFLHQRSDLMSHMYSKHTSSMVPCAHPGCDKAFTFPDSMLRHCREDHEQTISVESSSPTSNRCRCCSICKRSSQIEKAQDQRSNLIRHMLAKHTSHRVLCSQCDWPFTRSDNMRRHSQKRHGVVLVPRKRKEDD